MDVIDENEVYSVVSKTISRLLPDVHYIITKLMPDEQNFRIVKAFGFEMFFDIIQNLIDKELHLINFQLNKLTDKQIDAFRSRKIYHFAGGIHESLNEVLDAKPVM